MDKNSSVPVTASSSAHLPETELRIHLDAMDISFEGPRAALEAEGLIPESVEWPEGKADAWWKTDLQTFALSRLRPPGHKGPMKSWLEGDWWRVRVRLIDGPGWEEIQIRQKIVELAHLKWQFSAAGGRATREMFRRIDAAAADGAFQAFKARLPGVLGKRKGRSAAAAEKS